jgi:hypothetical protein
MLFIHFFVFFFIFRGKGSNLRIRWILMDDPDGYE